MGMFIFGIIWTLYSIHCGYLFAFRCPFDEMPIVWKALVCMVMSPILVFVCIIFGFLALFSNGAKEIFLANIDEIFPI